MGKRVDFDGTYFSAHVECFPKPTEGKIHLIGGGRNPKIIETLSGYVDEWNIFGTAISRFKELKTSLEKSDREIQVSQMGSFVIADSEGEIDHKINAFLARRGMPSGKETAKSLSSKGVISGTPSEFVSEIGERVDAGIEKFYFQFLNSEDYEMLDTLTETLRSI
jgi:alkanesulfonate monooxygenase SsuD/methylene tetrahydromethanopterin reductase-like flavin-dependent oxidoreductase (luciferase family)